MKTPFLILLSLLCLWMLAACQPSSENTSAIRLEVQVDGTRSTYTYESLTSVGQFLDAYEIEVSPLDDINPPRFTQISNGMLITIIRVTEETECEERVIEKTTTIFRVANDELPPGEIRVVDPGADGLEQICYRVLYKDGVENSRTPQRTLPLIDPQPRIEYHGIEDRTEPVNIEGTLVYIADGQAHLMQQNSGLRRPLTTRAGLDGFVFDLSPDGRQLLYTRKTDDPNDPPFANELWFIPDVTASEPVELQIALNGILTATWRPNAPNTFAYSTANPDDIFLGWSAYNDLRLVQIDPLTGDIIDIDSIIAENQNAPFAQWGTRFKWSPDGSQMAYATAEGVGLIDFDSGGFDDLLLRFPFLDVASEWVWQPQIGWSEDGQWIVTTVHGPPFGSEQPVNSVVFNMGVININNRLIIDRVIEQIGMWSTPLYSGIQRNALDIAEFNIAYLQARDPLSSLSSEYDLVIADRDGSNPRILFPGTNLRGIRPVEAIGDHLFVWSPSGDQIAIVYQDNLWLVDVVSGESQRVTSEGPVQEPRWVR